MYPIVRDQLYIHNLVLSVEWLPVMAVILELLARVSPVIIPHSVPRIIRADLAML